MKSATSHEIRLVLVGHFGFAEDHTPAGSFVSLGGSGYACAVGAGAGDPRQVGVVAHIGDDFDIGAITRLDIDGRGAVRMRGPAPRLTITQHSQTERSFESTLGVAATPATGAFPRVYAATGHVHLATMPPSEQVQWLRMVRRALPESTISVDMFEVTTRESRAESLELCYAADLVFMNEMERRTLFAHEPMPTRDIVLKDGARGAALHVRGTVTEAAAPFCEPLDTTGAGEVLAGAFLSLRAMGISAVAALRYAVVVASAKVTESGVDGPNLRRAIDRVHTEVSGVGAPRAM